MDEVESHIVRLQPEIQRACVDLVRPRDVSGGAMLLAAVGIGEGLAPTATIFAICYHKGFISPQTA